MRTPRSSRLIYRRSNIVLAHRVHCAHDASDMNRDDNNTTMYSILSGIFFNKQIHIAELMSWFSTSVLCLHLPLIAIYLLCTLNIGPNNVCIGLVSFSFRNTFIWTWYDGLVIDIMCFLPLICQMITKKHFFVMETYIQIYKTQSELRFAISMKVYDPHVFACLFLCAHAAA